MKGCRRSEVLGSWSIKGFVGKEEDVVDDGGLIRQPVKLNAILG